MRASERLGQPASIGTPAIAALNRLSSAAGRILSRWPDVLPDPPPNDRERLVQEVRRRLFEYRWDGVRMSLMTSAARALFDTERRARADLGRLRDFYAEEIRASSRPSFLSAMLAVYIDSFVLGAQHTRSLAAALTAARSRFGARAEHLLHSFPECLDATGAPEALARRMVQMQDCWSELKASGIRSPHAPGLMEHVHLAYVRLIGPELKTRIGREKLFRWLKPANQKPLVSGAGAAITALLGHWLDRDPPQDELTELTQALIALYSDPRVNRAGVWAGVPEKTLAVLFRWLTGENIRFFLDVVSAVEESHMWAPRRDFWLGLYKQGRIDAAWVAFSEAGVAHARRLLSGRGDETLVTFGRQTAGGARIDTSLLILKIGSKIVVEGSHNYRVHVFREDNPKSPRLYDKKYDCESIRLTPGADAKSHLGNWQGWVLERI